MMRFVIFSYKGSMLSFELPKSQQREALVRAAVVVLLASAPKGFTVTFSSRQR